MIFLIKFHQIWIALSGIDILRKFVADTAKF